MNFSDIQKKAESALGGSDGKIDYKELGNEAQSAYGKFNSTEGSVTDKAKAAYSDFQTNHSKHTSSEGSGSEKKEESK